MPTLRPKVMAFRNFPTKTQAELEAQLALVENRILSNIGSAGGNGSQVTFTTQTSLERVRDMIVADLTILDPTHYSARNQRVSRTIPEYNA